VITLTLPVLEENEASRQKDMLTFCAGNINKQDERIVRNDLKGTALCCTMCLLLHNIE